MKHWIRTDRRDRRRHREDDRLVSVSALCLRVLATDSLHALRADPAADQRMLQPWSIAEACEVLGVTMDELTPPAPAGTSKGETLK
jgi:hypothetical protein